MNKPQVEIHGNVTTVMVKEIEFDGEKNHKCVVLITFLKGQAISAVCAYPEHGVCDVFAPIEPYGPVFNNEFKVKKVSVTDSPFQVANQISIYLKGTDKTELAYHFESVYHIG